MKNKPAPALLRPSNQSNEIKKRVPESRETIPLNKKTVTVGIGTKKAGHNLIYALYCTYHSGVKNNGNE
jgi:hypothetical protein